MLLSQKPDRFWWVHVPIEKMGSLFYLCEIIKVLAFVGGSAALLWDAFLYIKLHQLHAESQVLQQKKNKAMQEVQYRNQAKEHIAELYHAHQHWPSVENEGVQLQETLSFLEKQAANLHIYALDYRPISSNEIEGVFSDVFKVHFKSGFHLVGQLLLHVLSFHRVLGLERLAMRLSNQDGILDVDVSFYRIFVEKMEPL